MENNIKEVEGQIICMKYNHNLPVQLVNIDEYAQKEERLLCFECLNERKQVVKFISIKQAQESIKEKLQNMNYEREENINKYMQIVIDLNQFINEMQSHLFVHLQQLLFTSQQWLLDLQYFKSQKPNQIDLLEQLELLMSKNSIYKNEEMAIRNQNYVKKMIRTFQEFQIYDFPQKCQEVIERLEIFQPKQAKTCEQIANIICEIPEISSSQTLFLNAQENQQIKNFQIGALSFNYEGSLLCYSYLNELKICSFNSGELLELQHLDSIYGSVYCIVFSKRCNSFITGNQNGSVCSWKQRNSDLFWVQNFIGSEHKNSVTCMTLNNKEDQLITCGLDQRILVWNINNNQISFQNAFEQRHTDSVVSISLNNNETILVSSGLDKLVILWKYQIRQRKWTFLSHLIIDDYGKKVRFINNFEIFLQLNSRSTCQILRFQDNMLVPFPDTIFDLENQNNGSSIFLNNVNNNKLKILVHHNRSIYFLQKKLDGKLKLIAKPIFYQNSQLFAILSPNEEYLVSLNIQSNEISVQKMNYD